MEVTQKYGMEREIEAISFFLKWVQIHSFMMWGDLNYRRLWTQIAICEQEFGKSLWQIFSCLLTLYYSLR